MQKGANDMDISVMIDNFVKWYSDKIKESNTRKELEVLSDKELSDIGISRCDIDHVSKGGTRRW